MGMALKDAETNTLYNTVSSPAVEYLSNIRCEKLKTVK
jgi:hypothetical protein